jgi:hypothetical protein
MGIDDGASPRIDLNVIVSNTIDSGNGVSMHFQDAGEAYVMNNIIDCNDITNTMQHSGSGISIFLSPVKFINNMLPITMMARFTL